MFKKFIAAAALLPLAGASFAAEPDNFYLGLDGGRARLDHVENDSTTYGALVGYSIGRYWAAEVAVRNLGKSEVPAGDLKLTQASASVVAIIIIGKGVDFFGRFGYNHVNIKNNSRAVTLADSTLNGGNVGFGFVYHFTPHVAARLEYQKAAADLRNVSAGAVFSF